MQVKLLPIFFKKLFLLTLLFFLFYPLKKCYENKDSIILEIRFFFFNLSINLFIKLIFTIYLKKN